MCIQKSWLKSEYIDEKFVNISVELLKPQELC